MPLAKYNDIIKTFAPDRADQPFAMPIVPWGLRRRWPISNTHRPNASAKDFAVGSIRIADQILWCALSRKLRSVVAQSIRRSDEL
jgi:hypothetical protein